MEELSCVMCVDVRSAGGEMGPFGEPVDKSSKDRLRGLRIKNRRVLREIFVEQTPTARLYRYLK